MRCSLQQDCCKPQARCSAASSRSFSCYIGAVTRAAGAGTAMQAWKQEHLECTVATPEQLTCRVAVRASLALCCSPQRIQLLRSVRPRGYRCLCAACHLNSLSSCTGAASACSSCSPACCSTSGGRQLPPCALHGQLGSALSAARCSLKQQLSDHRCFVHQLLLLLLLLLHCISSQQLQLQHQPHSSC